ATPGRGLHGKCGKRVHGAAGIVTIIKIHFAVVVIGAAFSHGIHDCPSSAAILGRVVGSINLKFLHGGLGAGVANARATPLLGKECLIVITTIDGVIVGKSAHAAKADQAKTVGITDRARSEEIGRAHV